MIAASEDLSTHPSTIGKPIKGLSAKLMLNNQPVHTVGELYIKCTWSTLGNNQWVATGDLPYRDAAGYYYLKGRADDMIISGGENIYPFELEKILSDHPHIANNVVISVQDLGFEQRLETFIVLQANATQTAAAIHDWLKTHVARYQMPKKSS